MAAKKYPIGTKIRFIHPTLDNGKVGKIVGYYGSSVDIYLPTAHKHIVENYHPTLSDGTKFTWHCSWYEIEKLGPEVGEQLLFSFMEE